MRAAAVVSADRHHLGSVEGVVVDADEEVVPACFAFGAARPTGQGVAGAFDAAEPFNVDVDQLARSGALVAHDGLFRLGVEACLAVAAEDRVHG